MCREVGGKIKMTNAILGLQKNEERTGGMYFHISFFLGGVDHETELCALPLQLVFLSLSLHGAPLPTCGWHVWGTCPVTNRAGVFLERFHKNATFPLGNSQPIHKLSCTTLTHVNSLSRPELTFTQT